MSSVPPVSTDRPSGENTDIDASPCVVSQTALSQFRLQHPKVYYRSAQTYHWERKQHVTIRMSCINCLISLPVAISHKLSEFPLPPNTNRPSGEKATLTGSLEDLPINRRTSLPVAVSHNLNGSSFLCLNSRYHVADKATIKGKGDSTYAIGMPEELPNFFSCRRFPQPCRIAGTRTPR